MSERAQVRVEATEAGQARLYFAGPDFCFGIEGEAEKVLTCFQQIAEQPGSALHEEIRRGLEATTAAGRPAHEAIEEAIKRLRC